MKASETTTAARMRGMRDKATAKREEYDVLLEGAEGYRASKIADVATAYGVAAGHLKAALRHLEQMREPGDYHWDGAFEEYWHAARQWLRAEDAEEAYRTAQL